MGSRHRALRALLLDRPALELDPTIGEAHAVVGRILFQFDWDGEGAERHFRRALERDPNDPYVLHCYSLILGELGRFDEALALANRALAQDPASVVANRDKGIILYLARRYDDSIQQFRRTLELDRYYVSVYPWLAFAYEALERPDQAVEAYITPLTFSEENRKMVASLRQAAKHEGLKGFWKRRLQFLFQEREVRIGSIAQAYVNVGDHDRALDWLEKLYEQRGAYIRTLKRHPRWDPLRADRRFQDLLLRADMPQPPMRLLSQPVVAK